MSSLPETPLLYSDEQLALLLLEAQQHERQRLIEVFARRLNTLASHISLCQYNSSEATELLHDEADAMNNTLTEEAH